MTQSSKKRPTAVSVVGWICIVWGFWGMFCGVWKISHWICEPAATVSIPQAKELVAAPAKLAPLMVFAEAVWSLVEFIGGIYLLKLRAWARAAIEAVAWLEILVYAVGPMMWSVYVVCFTTTLDDLPGFKTQALEFLALGCAWILFVNGLIIYFVRSKKVREAVAGPPRGTP